VCCGRVADCLVWKGPGLESTSSTVQVRSATRLLRPARYSGTVPPPANPTPNTDPANLQRQPHVVPGASCRIPRRSEGLSVAVYTAPAGERTKSGAHGTGWGVTRHPGPGAAQQLWLLYRNKREIGDLRNSRRALGQPPAPGPQNALECARDHPGRLTARGTATCARAAL